MKPLVSILIPAYNSERWIADAIRSALAQTWSHKEVVIVDDGSTDQTLSVARGFASKNVCVETQPNQGASAARNTAFTKSQGDYITWLDADDMLAPDKLEVQVKALDRCQSERTLLSGAWGTFFYRCEKARFNPSPLWQDLSPAEWLRRKIGQDCHMQTATWLVSRKLTEAAGPWDVRLWKDNDGEYICRVILACDGVRFIPEAKVYYRETDYNRVSFVGRSNKKLESQFLSMQLHIGYLRSLDDSAASHAACLKYLQKYMFDYHPDRPDIVERMQQIAANLGGRLEYPRSSWKYAWIEKLFGWNAAKRAQIFFPTIRQAAWRWWDKAMYSMQRDGKATSCPTSNETA
ncbi:MAG TPA: glycosyltransferase family 2 protein [Candidatus Nitrosotalea sp.]|nr:glycosyltransferase family 2 protein [Candidatus Nitrosotalea sp.]